MEITSVDVIIFIVGFSIALYFYGTRKYKHFKNTDVKYFTPPLPFLGSTFDLLFRRRHFRDFLLEYYEKCGDEKYIGLFEVQKPLIFVKDPEIIKAVGIKEFDNFHNHRAIITEEGDPLFGNALISLQDEKWRDMRATLSPAFTGSKMKNMFVLIDECARNFANFYVKDAKNNKDKTVEIEAKKSFTIYTNDVIATSAFGLQMNTLEDPNSEFYELGKSASDFSGWTMMKFAIHAFFPTIAKMLKLTLFSSRVTLFFRNLVQDTMANREETGTIRHDMIDLLAQAKKGSLKHESGPTESTDDGFATVEESALGKRTVSRNWSDDELAAQALIFFIGGFETTSNLIIYFMYEMARNPDVQTKVQEEIDEFMKNSNGKVAYSDMKDLKYLDMAVSETLRMWPPILAVDRLCTKEFDLPPPNEKSTQTYRINKNESIWIPIYALHFNPKYYPDPSRFDPERFSDENKSSINPQTYLPFGIGPRNCIGSRFALMVGKLIVFHILAKFDIVPTENTQIPVQLSKDSFGLKSEKGVYIGLKLRSS